MVVVAASGGSGMAAAAAPARLETVGTFAQPVAVTAPAGDRARVFVVERRGLVRIVRDGRTLRRPFADLSRQVVRPHGPETVDQRGLFSLAFAPDYARSGLLYAFFVDRRGHLRVDGLQRDPRDPDRIDPRRRRTVIDLGRVSLQHHGGQLQFGPDGMLWISTGQDDEPASSRDLRSLHGKLLRIDPRGGRVERPYRVPADNPYLATTTLPGDAPADVPAARPEIAARGLRNPWRFSFDRPSGLLLIGDVGDTAFEEVDALPVKRALGADFGWDRVEGRERRGGGTIPGYVAPAIVHRHSRQWCAVVGGLVVRDPRLPRLAGSYLYGDVCSGWLWAARLDRAGRAHGDRRLALRVPYLVSFGTDGRGRVYAVSLSGAVVRLVG
ncbi:sorbosone dehydrogenase family protein [Conexibacter sp. CPCC 206217]|uniref:PQQ-dependent sugar dehydrogenase n=1 Tax=Conexibacter sp. CPCC 206217 TaxID=3064574 RepID=UPI0027171062|nr:PQQ-dependent sugar dehydrogenase [Conexibacter sp. CPCC 206217]MDO8209078.1 PQQ-dependent sugar dehydrogenase [Conexibacter sp. CPCC 206217]